MASLWTEARQVLEQAKQIRLAREQESRPNPFEKYQTDPVLYCREVLHAEPTDLQEAMMRALLQPPYRVLAFSGHSIGKTWFAAATVNWWYDCFDPGVCISTAPTLRDVKDILWTEIRIQRAQAGLGDLLPAAPEMRTDEKHWAKGYTASRGESLDAETVIDTPDGRRRFGDLRIGDAVFGADGTSTIVTGVFHNGIRDAFRVGFSDGSSVVADANHLWSVINPNNGARGWLGEKYGYRNAGYELLTTAELVEKGVTYSHNGRPRNKFFVPWAGPAQYPHREIPVPAYTMGVWLGDGTCHNGSITSGDPEMFDLLSTDNPGLELTRRQQTSRPKNSIYTIPELRGTLRGLGLLGGKTENKRVPREYLENDVAVRLAILQGLMDTDGWSQKEGGAYFGSTSEALVDDVVWLTRSLGGWASKNASVRLKERPEGGFYLPSYRACIRLKDFPLFRLVRKQQRIKCDFTKRRLGIREIELCGQKEMVCITVAADDGLFLANDFKVTHNSFQGRHRDRMLFVFDEGVGVDPVYWTTTRTMFRPEPGNAWLVIGNPTDTTSQAYLEDCRVDSNGDAAWHRFSLSAMDHPNVAVGLANLERRENGEPEEPLPYPSAVTVEQIHEWVEAWCDPVEEEDVQSTDIEWPPGSGFWFRPGPEFESRCLGLWPSSGTKGVWSDALWKAVEKREIPDYYMAVVWEQSFPEIGADIARHGDDWSSFHARVGPQSQHHESHNGWDTVRSADRLREMAEEWAAKATVNRDKSRPPVDGKSILIKVDDDGVGGGVTDMLLAWGYSAVAVNAKNTPSRPDLYPDRRSELWFQTASRGKAGVVSFALLPVAVRQRLRVQLMSPQWEVDRAGRRVVEPKKKTKEKIGRSPDDADAVHLAYLEGMTFKRPGTVPNRRGELYPEDGRRDRAEERKPLYPR